MSQADERARRKKRMAKRLKRRNALRPKYPIELNKEKYPEHKKMAAVAEDLLDHRKFNTLAVRGVLITAALEQGNIEPLLDYYPDVVEKVKAMLRDADDDDLKQIIADQGRRIAELSNAIMGLQLPAAAPLVAAGLKPLAGAIPLPMPVEDEEDTVVLRRDTSTNSADNFLNNMLNLQPHLIPGHKRGHADGVPAGVPSNDDVHSGETGHDQTGQRRGTALQHP